MFVAPKILDESEECWLAAHFTIIQEFSSRGVLFAG
jgi:hypothetical protein